MACYLHNGNKSLFQVSRLSGKKGRKDSVISGVYSLKTGLVVESRIIYVRKEMNIAIVM